jgi:photosystem II stability/assembly factor-like uncharacterized protein
MKRIILLLTILLAQTAYSQWESCHNDSCNYSIYSMCVNGKNIYAGTNNGEILVSTDNGYSWTTSFLKKLRIKSLAVRNNSLFAGNDSGIYISSNNGKSWTCSGLSTHSIMSILFLDNNNIIASSDTGLFKSTNNGKEWLIKQHTSGGTVDLIANTKYIIAADHIYGIWISSDNGDTWVKKNKNLLAFNTFAVSNNIVLAGESDYGIYLSFDFGETWETYSDYSTLTSVCISGTNYFYGSFYEGIRISKDTCKNWYRINSGLLSATIQNIVANDNYIFVGTSGCGVFRAKINAFDNTKVEMETLYNNCSFISPNPASDILTINSPMTDYNSKIEIYNIYGIKVIEVPYTNQIDVSSLVKGIYYLKINNKMEKFIKM